MSITHTHVATKLPYNGNNPNNCSCCGIRSASWSFTPLDIMNSTIHLCYHCRTSPVGSSLSAYIKYDIVPDVKRDFIEYGCWYRTQHLS
jgi:hypothetical protein